MLWWALVVGAAGEPEPTDHTLIYYNARMALREGQALEATKLWLLRNALERQTATVSTHDADFHSVTWVALGDLGICQDGHPTDEAGAGLWPLALHNWVVRNMSRRVPAKKTRPFDAFEVGRQQRFVSIGDVLGSEELGSVSLFRGRCIRPRLALLSAGLPMDAELSDRLLAARLLQHLLQRARSTLASDVRGRSVVEARLFDVHLQITAMAARQAEQAVREQARTGRQLGLSRESVAAISDEPLEYGFAEQSEPARILRGCVDWPVSEWMALSSDRRRFLFHHARATGGDPEVLDRTALGIIDALIERREGEEVQKWIAQRAAHDGAAQEAIWSGDRGQRLLALDREAGFQERAVIALHRGVRHLEGGDLPSALRSMAYALDAAPDSLASDDVQALSRRWLSYAVSQFELTDDLLATLQALVPRRDYSQILEDLMWRAAFHADRASFDRGLQNQLGRDASERRMALMEPLASGDIGRFTQRIRDGLAVSPTETLRFLQELLQRLELEDAEVRAAHVPTLRGVRRLLVPLTEGSAGGRGRTATGLLERSAALVEGVDELGPDASARDRARSLAPSGEVFAGSVRLAPADPLPWPFRAADVQPPPIFTPIQLTPVEWRGPDGWVFGWSIGG